MRRIYEGQKIGIVGGNGCGKTTLINILLGRLEATSGECIWIDKELQIGYMSQGREEIEEQLCIENKIAYLVGTLSTLEVGSSAYIELEDQYMQLMKLRNEINK